ncbi:MAG: DMT family transporter [Rhodospirillaceae bacterium]|nr:DMT family transporter [Rhodospirillaceae bacterium]
MKRAQQKFNLLSAPVRGAIWMVIASTMLGTINVLVRHISADLHPFEIAFFRNFGQFAFMLPWLVVSGFAVMKTKRIGAHIRRSMFGMAAMLTWFSALSLLPVAKVTALGFTAPLFATIGAALILREKVRARRWVATIIGFIGALIILRPGINTIGSSELVALGGAALIAFALLSNKSLARTEQPNAMVLWMGFLMSIFSLPPAIYVWQWPVGETWAWLAMLGVVATLAHLSINRAFVTSDASYVMPFGFVQLPAVAIMAFFMFGEVSDIFTWVGAAIIFASGIYITRREAAIAKAGEAVVIIPQPAVEAIGHSDKTN